MPHSAISSNIPTKNIFWKTCILEQLKNAVIVIQIVKVNGGVCIDDF